VSATDTSSAEPPSNLQKELDTLLTRFLAEVPEEVAGTVRQATREIAESGVAEQCLQAGMIAPDFTLPDQHGKSVSLAALLAEGPVVVSFYRGGWCPFCGLELDCLQSYLNDIHRLGAQLLAVSPQSAAQTRSTAETHGLIFPVLSDAANKVARQYGLVYALPQMLRPIYLSFGIDLPLHNDDGSYDLPVPATYVIDTDGVIRLAYANADYSKRLDPARILDSLQSMAAVDS